MGIFAPPDLFAAMAIAARGDADLPDGAHLRLMPSPVLGFPIAPFAIVRITPFLAEPSVLWRDRSGKTLPEPALDAAGGLLNADLGRPPAGPAQDVAVELLTDGTFKGSIVLIDRAGNRELSRRSRAPFIVGGPRVDRVQIIGKGKVLGLRTWRVDPQTAIEPLLGQQPGTLLSLPIDGTRPWYAKGLGPAAAFDRVVRGATRRLQRPDRPDGPFDPLAPADDRARVAAHAADLDKQCEKMVGNIAIAPRQQRLVHLRAATPTAARHIVNIGIADTLFVHAMDPGLGRYLGLVGAMDEPSDGGQPVGYVAVGLFVFSTFTKAPDGRSVIASLGSRPAIMAAVEEKLLDQLGARDVLDKLIERYNLSLAVYLKNVTRLEFRGLLAVAGLVPPPDPPTLPVPTLGNAHWLDGQGRPSTTFRQDFLFPASPLGSLVALGRQENGIWTTRHQTIDLPAPADPKRRALTMLMGRTQPSPIDLIFVTIPADYLRRSLISDAPIPAGGAAARYRAALADLFGRFGPPAEFDVPEPARPRPPAPAPQVNLVLDGPRGAGGPPASPGHIAVVVGVPPVEQLAAGSLDIAFLELSFEGGVEAPIAIAPIPAGGTRTITHTILLRALNVAERTNGTLTARFRDSAGALSDPADVNVSYGDRRQPKIVPTGLGIIWTSKPGPSPDVELKLTWPATPNVRYRVYIADEKGLEVAGDSRAEIAVEGGQRDRARTLGGREHFRLLTDPPLVGAGGAVTLNEHLPRALTTVQFLRVVPLTPQGREAKFDSCGIVPVAVPSDRTPPPPRVRVSVDADTGAATVTITGLGLDLVELEASEPGLFTEPPTADAMAPEFRLRRASGPVNDPIYAREIARGPLEVTREDGVVSFTATIDDPVALGPFIRYSYWAEVRMPPERRLARVVEIPPAGGVRPVVPAQLADMPRPFSAVSAPASVLHVPNAPVPTLADATVSVISDGVTLRASLSAPATPTSAPKAVGPYLLRIWQQWGDTPIVSAGPDVELDGSPLAWEGAPVPDDADHPQPLTLRFVVIDPVGRESKMTIVTAP